MSLGLIQKYNKSPKTFVDKLAGCGYALQLSELAAEEKKPLLIVCSSIQEAQQLSDELPFFLNATLKKSVHFFPDWETLPYDAFSPHEDIIAQRITVLANLLKDQAGIYLVTAATLMQKLAPKKHLSAQMFLMKPGDIIDIAAFRENLISLGYQCVSEVIRHGEFAIRGAIIDIFPSNSDLPYRLDLFDNEIESIRTFSTENQRSIEKKAGIELLPASEFCLQAENIALFQEQWKKYLHGNPDLCPFFQSVSQGKAFGGIEYYLPLFFNGMSSLLDYCHENFVIIYPKDLSNIFEQHWKEIRLRYEQKSHDITQPLLPPEHLWFNVEDMLTQQKRFNRYRFSATNTHEQTSPALSLNPQGQPLLSSENRYLVSTESRGRQEILKNTFLKQGITLQAVKSWQDFLETKEKFCISIAPLWSSFCLNEHRLMIVSEHDLYGNKVQQRRRNTDSKEDERIIFQNIAELNVGDPVVHLQHGIGRYLGLETLKIGEQTKEFISIAYRDENKLFVPITHLHLLSRYSVGESHHAPLHALGNDQWIKARKKALEKAYDAAADLLEIYARREQAKNEAMHMDAQAYEKFKQGFPFEETPDQAAAIQAVLKDLQSTRPMDRVICGDVGFGKTEVAMRAAFLTAYNHQQVALLVPTTLLAEQHGENFINRFSEWPVKIAVLSRFKTAKEQEAIIKDLHDGKIDIVIGTHKLLQEGIEFHHLGLLIIDEEHRFGVRQKEKFKKLKAKVNILTMTATPIPRTLSMTMNQLRDLSMMTTPPAKRLSIKTFLYDYQRSVITEAIERELHRGGQIFFLHNNVATIEHCAAELKDWLPNARIRFAHGQLSERELENIMVDFYHQRFDVLVCTTIIETGIDIPTANTIIIDRADKLGLAQLHQLRGRVGRSHHQAYAYLLYPDKKALASDARKRLEAISSLGDLGAGFQLASHDLEIRGAGEFLGEEQSGQIQEVGFSLYLELIEKAVKTLKAGKSRDDIFEINATIEVDLGLTALIPENYMPDIHSRLQFYKRLSDANNDAALDTVQAEMIDRFGFFKDEIKNLIATNHIRITCQKIGIKKLSANKQFIKLDFSEHTHVEPSLLIKLIQTQPSTYQLINQTTLKVIMKDHAENERAQKIKQLLSIFT